MKEKVTLDHGPGMERELLGTTVHVRGRSWGNFSTGDEGAVSAYFTISATFTGALEGAGLIFNIHTKKKTHTDLQRRFHSRN